MATNHYPDGLTIEAITALQREVNDELRREGYPVQPVQQAFMAARPAPAHPQRSSGHRGRSADDAASSPGSGDL